MSSAGAVAIQACAARFSRLDSTGFIDPTATAMIVDDKPIIKFTAKPVREAGVEITPKSACGAPIISYKDCDRDKRWDVTLDIGDADFDKMELLGGGALFQAPTSGGRSVSDGVTVLNSPVITSATAAFVSGDVGRTVTGIGIAVGSYVASVQSSTSATMSLAATAAGTGISLTFGALAAATVAYSWPQLICTACPNGVAIELWLKAIQRCSGFQGTTPYPSVGGTPVGLPSSPWIRLGVFRSYLYHGDVDVEDKEFTNAFTGWAIENPNFGLGPVGDWTTTAQVGGTPIPTVRWASTMMDFQLPTPLQPGYQTVSSPY